MAAALTGAGGPPTATTLAYAEIPQWLTGMGVSLLRPNPQALALETAS
jgi:2,3-dihydroxyphenylpropionate 1,2-dioxygenase